MDSKTSLVITELIEVHTEKATDKQKTIDFARLLHKPETDKPLYWDRGQFTKVSGVKDEDIIASAQKAIENKEEVTLDYTIKNTDRACDCQEIWRGRTARGHYQDQVQGLGRTVVRCLRRERSGHSS